MSVNGAESWVRINAWDTDLTMDDLDAVVMEGLDGITLPKCSGPDDVKRLDFMLTDLEKKRALPVGGIKMAILIETAIGIMNVDQAVWCSDRLVAVIFGAVDYTRDMRVTRRTSSFSPGERSALQREPQGLSQKMRRSRTMRTMRRLRPIPAAERSWALRDGKSFIRARFLLHTRCILPLLSA